MCLDSSGSVYTLNKYMFYHVCVDLHNYRTYRRVLLLFVHAYWIWTYLNSNKIISLIIYIFVFYSL